MDHNHHVPVNKRVGGIHGNASSKIVLLRINIDTTVSMYTRIWYLNVLYTMDKIIIIHR